MVTGETIRVEAVSLNFSFGPTSRFALQLTTPFALQPSTHLTYLPTHLAQSSLLFRWPSIPFAPAVPVAWPVLPVMVLGKERAKGRAPDISLLTMAFNLPTPQDLRREAGRRASRDDAAGSTAATPRAPGRRRQEQTNHAGSSSGRSATSRDETKPKPVEEEASNTKTWHDELRSGDKDFSRLYRESPGSRPTELGTQSQPSESPDAPRARAKALSNDELRKPAVKSLKVDSAHHTVSQQTPWKRTPLHRLQKKPPKSSSASTSAKTPASAKAPTSTTLPASASGSASGSVGFPSVATTAACAPNLQTAYFANPLPHVSQHPEFAFAPQLRPVPISRYPTACFMNPSSYASNAGQASSLYNHYSATPLAPRAGTQGPTRHFYSELQHIQGHINQVNAKLSQNPGDKGLRHELQHLQNQLHSTLNTATAQAGFVGPSRQSEHVPSRSPEKKAQEVKAPEILVEECDNAANVSTKSPKVERAEVVREEAAASDHAGVVGPSRPSEHVPSKSPEKKAQEFKAPEILVEECDNAVNTRAKSPKAERAKIVREEAAAPARPSRLGPESPRLNVRHHLCSACGDVRSNTFHQKYPRILVRKPLLNYCGPCKEESIKHGKFVQRHHFCFGCGLVRSKDFEREHAATIGSPLLPNYCRRCRREVRDVESNVDASLVNSVSRSRRTDKKSTCTDRTRMFCLSKPAPLVAFRKHLVPRGTEGQTTDILARNTPTSAWAMKRPACVSGEERGHLPTLPLPRICASRPSHTTLDLRAKGRYPPLAPTADLDRLSVARSGAGGQMVMISSVP